ncbi:unnamed protein product, partial [Ectocarpus sp. 12 AP-2014]
MFFMQLMLLEHSWRQGLVPPSGQIGGKNSFIADITVACRELVRNLAGKGDVPKTLWKTRYFLEIFDTLTLSNGIYVKTDSLLPYDDAEVWYTLWSTSWSFQSL